MKGKIFLSGGGNEKKTYVLDEIFLRGINKILYIPIAWPNDDFENCLKWFTKAMSQHKKVQIEMLTNLNRKINLEGYGAVYIGGGNTFKLLKKIKESGFDKKLINYYEEGGSIYGGSAGAIIFGKNINTALICGDKDVNLVGLKDVNGLNQVKNYDIQCHFDKNQIREHQKFIEKSKNPVVAIPEESALLVKDNHFKVIGEKPVTVIKKNSVKKYKVNSKVLL